MVCRLLVCKSFGMKQIVVNKIPVGSVLSERSVYALAPVWRRRYKMNISYLLPIAVQAYHNAGGRDAASARHNEVFNFIRDILYLCCDGPKEDI